MSPTSYQLLHPATLLGSVVYKRPSASLVCATVLNVLLYASAPVLDPPSSYAFLANLGLVTLLGYGGGRRIRTFEGERRQIYSLIPLATREPLHEIGAGDRN